MLLSIVLAILLCLGGYWWYHYARIPNKFPNGPYGLPFIGYIGILKAPNLIEAFKGLIFIFASSTCARTSWNQTRNRNPCVGISRLRIEKQINLFFTPCSCFMKLTGNVLASILDRTSVAWSLATQKSWKNSSKIVTHWQPGTSSLLRGITSFQRHMMI